MNQQRPVFRSTLKLPSNLSALFTAALSDAEIPDGMQVWKARLCPCISAALFTAAMRQRTAGGVIVIAFGNSAKEAEKAASEIVVRTMWKLKVFAKSKKDPNYGTPAATTPLC